MLRLILVLIIAAVPDTCGLDRMVGPGQVDFHGELTVINRTQAGITVTSQRRTFSVDACSEATEEDFPLNWWDVTSPGRDMFHSGGGEHASHSFLVVTNIVEQRDTRPDVLPECLGLLQGAP